MVQAKGLVVAAQFTVMRIAAVVYVVLAVAANFFVDHPLVFALALLAYPVALWAIVSRRKTARQPKSKPVEVRDDTGRKENGSVP